MNNTATEKEIENYLVRKIRNFAGRTYKFISPTAAGVPDRIVLLNDCVFFVEVKRPDGELSLRQVKRLVELKGVVHHPTQSKLIPRCAVLSSLEEVEAWVLYVCDTVLPETYTLLGVHKRVGCLCDAHIARQIDTLLNLDEGDTYEPF